MPKHLHHSEVASVARGIHRMSLGFRTIQTTERLPGGKPCMMFDDNGDIVLIVNTPALLEDPEGALDCITRHCHANVLGHFRQLSIAV